MKITPDLFEAFLKCPTKCWLRVVGEPTSGNAYAEWVQAQNESYRTEAAKRLTEDLPADECASPGSGRRETHYSAETLKTAKWRFALDVPACTELGSSRGAQFAERTSPDGQQLGGGFGKPNETQMSPPENSHSLTSAATIENCLHAVERIPSAGRGQPAQFIPIRFIYRNKLTKDDKLLLVFDAFVVSEMLGRAVSLGKIIHGDDHAALKVKTSALAGEVRKRLERITALLASPAPPDLVLNRHCAECEFQARCRKLAVEKDDLSLLAGMSAKERQKLRSKGIFTVTQLSYTFRPRRRPKRQRDQREKYHHALKALAIREQKIHIVGSLELKLEGTHAYLDVVGSTGIAAVNFRNCTPEVGNQELVVGRGKAQT
jgi:predicted RecB family nuclease